MRYVFAAVIAVFVISADFESSDIRSVWAEQLFVVAEAQSEPAAASSSPTGTATASAESSQGLDAASIVAVPSAVRADADAHAAASVSKDSAAPDVICEAVKAAAEDNDIPIGFFVRLLWQESRFKATEVSSAGARGIAQFMPQTAVEVGLRDPFDPLQAIPASAKFLRKLHNQFGNLGLAAAAYNAGGGRIEKWLSRRSTLPKETRAYVKIITGHKAEAWIEEESTVYMPTDLPHKAPCEGVGGLSRQDQVATVNVDLTPSASAMVRKAEADEADDKKNATVRKLRVAASSVARRVRAAASKAKARVVLLAARKSGKKSAVRLASESSGRKSSRAAREL
jgi:Transglycosylase SLT domain